MITAGSAQVQLGGSPGIQVLDLLLLKPFEAGFSVIPSLYYSSAATHSVLMKWLTGPTMT